MALSTRQRRRVSLWVQLGVFVAVILLLVFSVNWGDFAGAFLRFDKAAGLFPKIIVTGLVNTVLYTVVSFIFGLTLGLILALMKLASFPPYRWIATGYIEFFRGVPALLVLITFGYGISYAFGGLQLPFIVIVMLSFGLVSAAYMAETLRAGLQAVPKGQLEAARSLGMSQTRAMITIIIPQAFRIVLPPLTNELILLTKDTSLVYVLGMAASQYELTKMGRDGMLDPNVGGGITPVLVAGLLYLIITVPLSLLARWFEMRSEQVSRPKRKKAKAAA